MSTRHRHIMRTSAERCATLTLTLTFKLKTGTTVTSALGNVHAILVFRYPFVFKLRARTRQTNKWTDGRTAMGLIKTTA